MPHPQLQSVQLLRGVAALAVVFGHLWQMESRFLADTLTPSNFLIGFAGVDLFFVLSGFVMVYVTRDHQPSAAANAFFLYKRITRIYPPYWVFLAVMIVALLVSPTTQGEPFNVDALLPSVLLLPHSDPPLLAVGWTLIHEMYFYLVFTALLFLPRQWLVYGLLAWLIAIIIGSGLDWHRQTPMLNVLFSPLTAEFLMGAGLAMWRPRLPAAAAIAAIGLGISGLLLTALLMGPLSIEGFPAHWQRVLVIGLPVFSIVLGMIQFEPSKAGRVFTALSRLGDWSYSLYLGHLIILATGAWIWSRIVPDLGWVDNLAFLVCGLAACITGAWLSYVLIERPMLVATRRIGHRLFPS